MKFTFALSALAFAASASEKPGDWWFNRQNTGGIIPDNNQDGGKTTDEGFGFRWIQCEFGSYGCDPRSWGPNKQPDYPYQVCYYMPEEDYDNCYGFGCDSLSWPLKPLILEKGM